jgi:hypothetical protein
VFWDAARKIQYLGEQVGNLLPPKSEKRRQVGPEVGPPSALDSCISAWANPRILGQPDTFLAKVRRGEAATPCGRLVQALEALCDVPFSV